MDSVFEESEAQNTFLKNLKTISKETMWVLRELRTYENPISLFYVKA